MRIRNLFFILVIGVLGNEVLSQCELNYDEDIILQNKHRIKSLQYPGYLSVLPGSLQRPDNYSIDGENYIFSEGWVTGLWFSGQIQNGKRVSVTGLAVRETDFTAGPISAIDHPLRCDLFNRTWLIKRSEIQLLNYYFESGILSLDLIPQNILSWPAYGNPYSEIEINEDLAPFYDRNSDGFYDPMEGDYPVPSHHNPELIPYQFAFKIFNDKKTHYESQSEPMNLEIHHMAYLFNCPELDEVNQAVFHDLKIINKGSDTIYDFSSGIMKRGKLGCYEDDYFGTSRELQTVYLYNSKGQDEQDCHAGENSIDSFFNAIQSTVILNGQLNSSTYYVNTPQDLYEEKMREPQVPIDYYNYLNGKWKDGTALTTGALGNDPGPDSTRYAFTDYPNQVNGWSMENQNDLFLLFVNIMNIYTKDMAPGDTVNITLADHIFLDSIGTGLDQFDKYGEVINNLKEEFHNLSGSIQDCNSKVELCQQDCVWPGDIDRDGVVTGEDVITLGLFVNEGYSGPERYIYSYDWFPFNSDNWNDSYKQINGKHADVNGNGRLNKHDISFQLENFGKKTTFAEPNISRLNSIPRDTIFIKTDTSGIIDFNDIEDIYHRLVNIIISLSNYYQDLDEDLHGLSYELEIDTNLVTIFETGFFLGSAFQVDFDYGNLRYNENTRESHPGRFTQFVHTNYNGQNVEKGTRLVRYHHLIKSNAFTNNPDGRDTLVWKLRNIFAMNADGDTINLAYESDTIILINLPVDPMTSSNEVKPDTEEVELTVFPNPAREELTIGFNRHRQMNLIIIVNATTAKIRSFDSKEKGKTLDISGFAQGIYFVIVRDEYGNYYREKFVKI